MKRVIITILIFLFGIGCGFGAFFMLKTGGDMKREELKSVQKLEAQEVEKENVPNSGTQKEEWNLSGTIEQCIIRYASKLDGDQMKQYRREILNEK